MEIGTSTIMARPTKLFFIDMITRDLSLTDCILDLIDNAIDHAVDISKIDVMDILTGGTEMRKFERATISLNISADELVIQDTCGGISINDAKYRIFVFGPADAEQTQASETVGLSVYGIGMKRAFFKLGNTILMDSKTSTESFRVNIDVNAWKEQGDDDWTFNFSEQNIGEKRNIEETGTTITVTGLWDGIKYRFSQPSFVKELSQKVASTYSLFIEAGIVININGEQVRSALPNLGTDQKITTARKLMHEKDVDILIIAGVTSKEDSIPRGWYIFCNGRMIIEADKTELTGWGSSMPKWHVKFNHFVGYAYFHSKNLRELPWTTTKRGIVLESAIYQNALIEMQIQSRPVLTFLSNLYPGDVEEEGIAEREVLQEAKPISINNLPRLETSFAVRLNDLTVDPQNREITIQYRKKKKELDIIKSCKTNLKYASYSQIGRYTFDYFIKQECQNE